MRVYTCNDHEGLWPVPTASVIVAENEEQARKMLTKALAEYNIKDDTFTLEELDIQKSSAKVLSYGDY